MSRDDKEERLTAYLLGELTEAERREMEAQWEAAGVDVEAELAPIRSTADLVRESFQQEDVFRLTERQRNEIEKEIQRVSARPRYKRLIYASSLAAAACILLAILIKTDQKVLAPEEPDHLTFKTTSPEAAQLKTTPESSTVRRGDMPVPSRARKPLNPRSATPSVATAATRLSENSVAIAGSTAPTRSQDTVTESRPATQATSESVPVIAAAETPAPAKETTAQKLQTLPKRDIVTLNLKDNEATRVNPQPGSVVGTVVVAAIPEEKGKAERKTASRGIIAGSGEQAARGGAPAASPAPLRLRQDGAMRNRAENASQPVVDFISASEAPVSIFRPRVGTLSSIENLRRSLNAGLLPPPEAVRIDEMVNSFAYGFVTEVDSARPSACIEIAAAPWNTNHRLALIQIKRNGAASKWTADSQFEVHFDPRYVKAYRRLGENFGPGTQSYADIVSQQTIGPDQTLSLLYEFIPSVLSGESDRVSAHDFLAVDLPNQRVAGGGGDKQQTFSVRYAYSDFEKASEDFQFATAVARFGMLLQDVGNATDASFEVVLRIAKRNQGRDPKKAEFVKLIETARNLAKAQR